MTKTALLLILYLLIWPNASLAEEKLRFEPAKSYKDRQVLNFTTDLAESNVKNYVLAHTDLNNDAIDEYIIKPASIADCSQKPLCPIIVVAFQEHKPILIAQFDAHKILISNKKTYGIRDIIVYNNRYNDFQFQTLNWSPYSFQYESFE